MTDFAAQTWQNEPSTATPIDAAALNRMEAGIDTAHSELHAHEADGAAHGATAAATPSTVVRRDSNGRVQVASPVAAADAATRGYVDTSVAGRLEVVGGGSMRIHRPGTTLPATGQQDDIFFRKPPA